MIILKCVEDFTVSELDEPQGDYTGEGYNVKKGSLWQLETDLQFEDVSDFDELNMIDDKGEYTGDWLCDIGEKTIRNNFKLLVDSQENQND